MKRSVIVIGGGMAGLSAATALAEHGCQVTVLEGRQVLGGRAYSFVDPKTGDSVDNGQHLFMGCYHETIRFLKRIGTVDLLKFQHNLTIDFVGSGGRSARLRCWPLPAPWHLLSGLLRLSTLSWGDRLRLGYMHQALREYQHNPQALNHMTVTDWLRQWKQSDRARRHLWDLITIATLNEDPNRAIAGPLAEVLCRAFFSGFQESQIGLSSMGLSDLYVKAAKEFVERRDGEVHVKSPVDRIEIVNGKAVGVRLRDGRDMKADWVISTVPSHLFGKLLSKEELAKHPVFQKTADLKAAPIISIHLWFDRAISSRKFAGLLDTHVQWFFNKSKIYTDPQTQKGYVSLVISGAHTFVDWTDTSILAMTLEELRRLFPDAREANLLRSLVIKEHTATLSPTVGSEELRPSHVTPIPHLLLAGDWTQTGLPATIESACVSGHACADIVMGSGASATAEPKKRAKKKEIVHV